MITITENYVSFELAKLLKEKEFKGDCIMYYIDNELINVYDYNYPSMYELENTKDDVVDAPTIQMAMKWLREVHKIDVWVEGWNRRYKGYIHSEQRGEEALFYEDSYEIACEAAIKYCLENLI